MDDGSAEMMELLENETVPSTEITETVLETFSPGDLLRLAAVGIVIPAILRLSSLAPGEATACLLSSCLLVGAGLVFDAFGDDGVEAERYVTVSAKLMILTFLGEVAKAFTTRCFRGLDETTELRTYECMALLLCGFLVLGQLVEVLGVVANGDFDKGVFLGIVVAGLSYSTRDMMSCLIYGLYESAYPAFHVGDTITIGNVHAQVLSKSMIAVTCEDGASKTRVPYAQFMKANVSISSGRTERGHPAVVEIKT
jgi:hypothetical protein